MATDAIVGNFADTVREAARTHEHLAVLLGNGFSIDFDPMFSYSSLVREVDLSQLHVDKEELFTSVGSPIFEVVIERLRTAARLTELYGGDARTAELLRQDARVVRNGLPSVLSRHHPKNSVAVSPANLECASRFLAHFSEIFTLNYDMLLYWVLMHDRSGKLPKRDGFGGSKGRVAWKKSAPQEVHYLHGALHLFLEHDVLRKLTNQADGNIIDAVRKRIEEEQFPLIVTEGTTDQKSRYIARHEYLKDAHRRLARCSGGLFIHGASMAENDDHVFERIESAGCGVQSLYVGVHGGSGSKGARRVMNRAEGIRAQRRELGGPELELRFYDASTAHVWRD